MATDGSEGNLKDTYTIFTYFSSPWQPRCAFSQWFLRISVP